jgi:hypothetical protein
MEDLLRSLTPGETGGDVSREAEARASTSLAADEGGKSGSEDSDDADGDDAPVWRSIICMRAIFVST